MAKKTKTLHGWIPANEDMAFLLKHLDEYGTGAVLFKSQNAALDECDEGEGIKRMTIRITIEDYHPKRPRLNAKDRPRKIDTQ